MLARYMLSLSCRWASDRLSVCLSDISWHCTYLGPSTAENSRRRRKILRPPKIRREYLRLVTISRQSIIHQLPKNFLAKSCGGLLCDNVYCSTSTGYLKLQFLQMDVASVVLRSYFRRRHWPTISGLPICHCFTEVHISMLWTKLIS